MDAGLTITERIAEIAKDEADGKDRNLIVCIAASSLPYQNSANYQKLRPKAAKAAANMLKGTYGATIFGLGDFHELNLESSNPLYDVDKQRDNFNSTMASICGNASTSPADGAGEINWSKLKSDHHILSAKVASVDYYRFTGYDSSGTPQFKSTPYRHTEQNLADIDDDNDDAIRTSLNIVPIPPKAQAGANYGEKVVITITDPVCIDYQWIKPLRPDFNPPQTQYVARATTYKPASPMQNAVAGKNLNLKFDGWYKDSACTQKFHEDGEDLTANTVLYGRWRRLTQTVTFKVQNGKWSNGSSEDRNVPVELHNGLGTLSEADVPTGMTPDTGYKAPGAWDSRPNTNTGGISEKENYVYTYTFPRENSRTVTYHWVSTENPISAVLPAPETVLEGTPSYTVATADPVAGWTFSGWYTNEDCTGDPVTEVKCSSTDQNIDLYGKWTHDDDCTVCTVTFLADYVMPGRGFLNADPQTVSIYTVPYGSTLQNAGKSLPTPVPGGGNQRFFNDWDLEEDSPDKPFYTDPDVLNMPVRSNLTFVAQWWPVVTFDANGGAWSSGETMHYVKIQTDTEKVAAESTPVRNGYTFLGWYTDDGNRADFEDTVCGPKTLYAHWAKNVAVTFRIVNGTWSGGAAEDKTVTVVLYPQADGTASSTAYKDERCSSGTKVTLDKTPTRDSYTFTDWYADKALTQKITSVTMNGDKTVYAGWEATSVPDKLNGDDHFAYVIGYPGGKVHPEGNISRAETATIFFRLLKSDIRDGNLTADNDFSDVSDGQWHNKAVSTMAKLGIVKGRRADRFDPNASITRAEFAAICARFSTRTVENSGNFSDISGHWAENEIERAAAFGWISGYPDGTFHPDARITRAEAMTMINRVLCRMPQSESDLLDSMVTWPDNKPSDWHYLAVQEATNSHDFNRQGEVGESWTKLTSVPDWTRYQ